MDFRRLRYRLAAAEALHVARAATRGEIGAIRIGFTASASFTPR